MSYKELKSGTDVRGIASDLGGKTVNLTDEAVYDITSAFATFVANKYGKKTNELTIAVGHDSRISAYRISLQVVSALKNLGCKVKNCNLASTPAMFMTTVDLNTDGAVQITASHHPFDRNGLKFFIKEGGLESSQLGEIIDIAEQGGFTKIEGGSVENVDYMSIYSASLRKMICNAIGKSEEEKPLSGYHIVVDAGNGVGGFYATDVLAPLGADISGSRFLEPDGMFPNHIPNPEDKTAMQSICEAVTESGADFGVIFDTDVDRAGCVDSEGNEINRNRLIALAAIIAANGKKDCTIVTDSVTSDGLKEFIEKDLGCKHYRYRRGYKNVIDKAVELCEQGLDCPLAIETSGHAALRENYFLDDGAYLITKIIIELGRGRDLNKTLKSLKMPAEERECRLNITEAYFKTYGLRVIDELEAFVSKDTATYKVADDNREGIRVSTPYGWFLLRLSVHDPVMPLNFESNEVGGIDKMVALIKPFFQNYSGLDISAIK
ncbi:MAG: phosphomannomutase/phosphoglucomutase [Clostridia bacterium]|nr:phosphomannomutase/phosphoglucomutase [Clostridia bacterium]